MNKDELRNLLFEKYFEIEEGVSAIDFVNYTMDIKTKWQELHHMLENGLCFFDSHTTMGKVLRVSCDENNYFIINYDLHHYLLLNIEDECAVGEEELPKKMDQNFFVENFGKHHYIPMISSFDFYEGNSKALIQFLSSNQEFFSLYPVIHYRLSLENAFTYFTIDVVNDRAQLGFETPDQFLYEQLFFNGDLSPFAMQDATAKIGVLKMNEIFERIKNIKLPKEVMSQALYEKVSTAIETGPVYLKK